ncbi:DUF4148 domain-containing protein [Melaminivora alkalimesophila]|uniref:Uncharacterized protein DUF4148 n=1 Tax=Melaminivora alkalimesophila TaxID=1165852 RepID=A0A317RBK9_9BURK|nr:DUF4148 domain-containing protein [Melaminivora alkalimesophila]PWW46894.1 uncharacterized protein DUF4148 [Melaminivora alkalimesophila]
MKLNTRKTLSILALAGASLAAPAFADTQPGQNWGEQATRMQMQGAGLSRAEVQADLNLWRRAGLENYTTSQGPAEANAEQARRMAEYQRLRSGPEYRREVQRLGGDVSTLAAYPSTTYQY